jgi:hypothetical protein
MLYCTSSQINWYFIAVQRFVQIKTTKGNETNNQAILYRKVIESLWTKIWFWKKSENYIENLQS